MNQEIHFFTGKGGVGKSIVALTMAYKKAQAGKKVLLVELGDQSFYRDLLDLDEVGYAPITLKPGLDLSLWTGADCLKEYARHLLKLESLYRLFVENPISRSLIDIAPALPEIAIMGKITSGPRKHGPQMNYDCIVVDGYATGHFLALVKAPYSMSQAVKFGPMGEQNRSIDRVLRDPSLCHYHIVTLPEELPIKETEELFEELKSFLEIKSQIIINKILRTDLTAAQLKKLAKDNTSIGDFADYVTAVLERQEEALVRIDKIKTENTTLDLITETDPWTMVKELAQEISP
jgi:anion-transporting  ArsA/GET3 family ATPase